MSIEVCLDILLVERKIPSNVLAEKIGINACNLSKLKTGKIKAIRFSTLEALCRELKCQPGDLLVYREREYPSFLKEGKIPLQERDSEVSENALSIEDFISQEFALPGQRK